MSTIPRHLDAPRVSGDASRRLLITLVPLAALLWCYWSTLVDLAEFWWRNQDYSVGMLVAPVAAWLCWSNRTALRAAYRAPSWLAGAIVIWIALLARLFGLYYGYGSAERYSFWLALVGAALFIGGIRVVWRARWIVAFCLLMIPLPTQIHEAISLPLQRLASALGAVALELTGYHVMREGNVLRINGSATVAVAEACSGLRMLTAFVFVTAVLAFLVKRPVWQKSALVLLSVPLAILANAVRIYVTASFVYASNDPALEARVHDFAGLAMMPFAVLVAFGVLRLLNWLSDEQPVPKHAEGAS